MPSHPCECGCEKPVTSPDKKGRTVLFKKGHRRKPNIWNFDRWDEGRIWNSAGQRMKVYRPDYPKSDKRGEALRSHVVWWLIHGEVVPKGYVIHHVNENTLDDRPANLNKMTQSLHSRHHHEKHPPVQIICAHCGKLFSVQYNIISQHLKEGRRHGQRFCSTRCVSDSRKGKRGHSRRGLTPSKVRQIRAMSKRGVPVREIMERFGLSSSGAYAIINKVNWSDVE